MAAARRCLLLLAALAALAACAAADSPPPCAKGDVPCHCAALGGRWKALAPPLLSACQVDYEHDGLGRYVNVYLPPAYDGVTPFPVWVHLHGVFWSTMGDIGARVGRGVNGTDIIPDWDRSVALLGDRAVIAYPQSLGDAGTGDEAAEGQGVKFRQFWSVPFWRCSVGICRPPGLDDVGFIEAVIADLPTRLAAAPGRLYLSGESAGGMLVHALLCQSKSVPAAITAAADLLGGIAAEYAAGPACAGSPAVPFLKLHGMVDPSLTYDAPVLVDGVPFLSAVDAAKRRAATNGCAAADAGPAAPAADGLMLCTELCGAAAPPRPAARLCGMPGVGHTTDYPRPGFVFEQAFKFFEGQADAAPKAAPAPRASKAPRAAAAAGAAGAAGAEGAEAEAEGAGPLTLALTLPGVGLAEFEAALTRPALAAVAAAARLPEANVSATYAAAPGGGTGGTGAGAGGARRRLLLGGAAPEARGVLARYALDAAAPGAAAGALVGAVRDGSLLAALERAGAAPPGAAAPRAALAAGARELLAPVSLGSAAAAGADARQAAAGAQRAAAAAAPCAPGTGGGGGDAAGAAAAASGGGGGGGGGRGAAVVAGAVVGALAGAALLAGGAWALAARRRRARGMRLPPGLVASVDASGGGGPPADAVMTLGDGPGEAVVLKAAANAAAGTMIVTAPWRPAGCGWWCLLALLLATRAAGLLAPPWTDAGAACAPGALEWPAGSGHCWRAREGAAGVGPAKGVGVFTSDNVARDAATDQLTLRVTRGAPGAPPRCAELALEGGSLGHGTFVWQVETPAAEVHHNLVGAAMLSAGQDREFDVEYARWGQPIIDNAQYVVQPYRASPERRFNLTAPRVTHRLRWAGSDGPGQISFEAWGPDGALITSWTAQSERGGGAGRRARAPWRRGPRPRALALTPPLPPPAARGAAGNNFAPGPESVVLSLWAFRAAPLPAAGAMTFNCFRFCPLGAEAPCETEAGRPVCASAWQAAALPTLAQTAPPPARASPCGPGLLQWPPGRPYCWVRRDSKGGREFPGNVEYRATNTYVEARTGRLALRVNRLPAAGVKAAGGGGGGGGGAPKAGGGAPAACGEVFLDRSLGYGDYVWEVETGAAALSPSVVGSAFIYESEDAAYDVEYGRWGDPAAVPLQYVQHPAPAAAATGHRFAPAAGGRMTHRVRWAPGGVTYETWDDAGELVHSWAGDPSERRRAARELSPAPRPSAPRSRPPAGAAPALLRRRAGGTVFEPGRERVHIAHWLFTPAGAPPSSTLLLNCFAHCPPGAEAECSSPAGVRPRCAGSAAPPSAPPPPPRPPPCPAWQLQWPPGSPYCWYTRDSEGARQGPGDNLFASANAALRAADGALVLTVAPPPRAGGAGPAPPPACAEVFLNRSLGLGDYVWAVETPPGGVAAARVASTFLYAAQGREFDIEFMGPAAWGDPSSPDNTQYVLQPWDAAGNAPHAFALPAGAGAVTHRLRWAGAAGPGDVSFESWAADGTLLHSWTGTGGNNFVPSGDERVHINHWIANATADGGAPSSFMRGLLRPAPAPPTAGSGPRKGGGPVSRRMPHPPAGPAKLLATLVALRLGYKLARTAVGRLVEPRVAPAPISDGGACEDPFDEQAAPGGAPTAREQWTLCDAPAPDVPDGFRVVASEHLAISVYAFYEQFLSVQASCLQDHHRSTGQYDFRASRWKADGEGRLGRVFEFMQPKRGICSANAHCVQEHRLSVHAGSVLVLRTDMTVQHVPYADAFTVHSFWRAQPDASGLGTNVAIHVGVAFSRRVLVRSIIVSNTLSDCRAFYGDFLAKVQNSIATELLPSAAAAAAAAEALLGGGEPPLLSPRRRGPPSPFASVDAEVFVRSSSRGAGAGAGAAACHRRGASLSRAQPQQARASPLPPPAPQQEQQQPGGAGVSAFADQAALGPLSPGRGAPRAGARPPSRRVSAKPSFAQPASELHLPTRGPPPHVIGAAQAILLVLVLLLQLLTLHDNATLHRRIAAGC
ncbi:VAD1 [Scenedesmus sp. PABB004]|nr:VAD1 [Scenedesmus sp. PABB004]